MKPPKKSHQKFTSSSVSWFPPSGPGRKLQRVEAEGQELEAENQALQARLEELRISSRRLEQLEVESRTLEQEASGLERDKRRLEKDNRRLRQQVSGGGGGGEEMEDPEVGVVGVEEVGGEEIDRKSTRLNSSHL